MTSITRRAALAALATAPLVTAAWQLHALRAPQALDLPPLQPAIGRVPSLGIHTRLTGIGDAAYIGRALDQVRAMGAHWITDLFPWAYAQPRSRYGFDWNGHDLVIRHAERRGLRVIARLDIVPPWARTPGSSDRLLTADRYVDYAEYVAAFLARYRPYGVRHVVIWNEPNLAFEWGRRAPDPEAYAALLREVYPRARAAAPDCVVVAGALSPGESLGGQAEVRLGDLPYTERFFAAGGGAWCDAWAVHSYGARVAHDSAPAATIVNFRRTEIVRDLLERAGAGQLPLLITEGGWNDSPRWSGAVRAADRVRWTIGAYELAQQWPWLEACCLWQFATPFRTGTYQDSWNFVAADGTPRAIYEAVRQYAVGP